MVKLKKDYPKVGIGVITMGIRKLKEYPRSVYSEFFVFIDKEKKGPGAARNKCLEYFSNLGCDHIFLFDDDCYPLKSGWEDMAIKSAEKNNVYFMALPEKFKSVKIMHPTSEIQYWNQALGCFTYHSKKSLETIGGYNTTYNRYGFEDAGIKERAKLANLCGNFEGFPFPIELIDIIHSEDVYSENPTPNIKYEDKVVLIKENEPIYLEELKQARLGNYFYSYNS